ncbi:MAG: type II toxin-antitoxin system RelE/ParE family toxin [Chitinivibrionales bacterium]|nr:type II toxin-antitoxin system RelE/ParE family toxin [Chitinivibrionales bacterium]MBD3355761.1 type II toxin-antitoxin system RelE/ParE family toxin [Chitinivibrionales bacterium]
MEYDVRLLDPANEFIDSLPGKMQAKVYHTIDMLKEFGYQLKEPWSKTLRNAEGMKELRVKLASNICRLFYFHHKDKLYVVTSGYTKKRDKTDKREIERALRLMHEVLREEPQ